MNIVLVEPEIPQNTGNIARTCAVTDCNLHLIRPLGFSTNDRYLKRAGLDYWHMLDIYYYDSLSELFQKYNNSNFYFATTKAPRSYHQVKYEMEDFILFGKETAGLSEKLLQNNLDNCIRIPMKNDARSLNLANSVAIIVYETLRQHDFPQFKMTGKLQS